MKLSQFIAGTALGVVTTTAAYLLQTKQTPTEAFARAKQSITETTADVRNLNTARHNFADKQSAFGAAMAQAQPAIEEIQKKTEQFSFKIQPRLDKINETVEHLNRSINDFNPR